MRRKCNAGWLTGLELVRGWDGKTQEAEKEARPPDRPDGDETCFGGGGGVLCAFVQGRNNQPNMGPKFVRL